MRRAILRRPVHALLSLLLAPSLACDEVDAPDRGAQDDAIALRPSGTLSTGGGSTLLNTARLFKEGLPLRHVDRLGAAVTYDDPAQTRVTLLSLTLATNNGDVEHTPASSTIEVEQGLWKLNGVVLPPGAMVGARLRLRVSDATHDPRDITLRITGAGNATVPGGTAVPLFNFSLDGAVAFYEGGPYSACLPVDALTETSVAYTVPDNIPAGTTNSFKVKYGAVLYGGVRVGTSGQVLSDSNAITLACVSGAVGKAALWGYPAWVSSFGGRTGVQQLQAVTRAIRADYCHDGTSHTADGTPIQVRDRFRADFDDPTEQTEAVWGSNGADCRVTRDRLSTGATYSCGGVVNTDCKQAASNWITGPDAFLWTKLDPKTTTYVAKTACNTPAGTPGCADPGIQAVVCAQDNYCCSVAWDSVCVGEVNTFVATAEACCADNGGTGCGSAPVTSCVGLYDPYCTQSRWDSLCALEVEHLNCGLCR